MEAKSKKSEVCSGLPLKTKQDYIQYMYIICLQTYKGQQDIIGQTLDRHWTKQNIHIIRDRQTNRYMGRQQMDNLFKEKLLKGMYSIGKYLITIFTDNYWKAFVKLIKTPIIPRQLLCPKFSHFSENTKRCSHL